MANFSSSGLTFFVFVIVFTVICGIFLLLRLWAATVSRRPLYLDDAMILFAYANCIALGGVGLWAAVNGLGKPGSELSEEEIVVNAKLIITSDVCWLFASVFVKMSILWLYNRIFAIREFRRWCWALMAVNGCYGVSFLVVYLTNCTPVDQLWNPTPDGHCRDMQISDFATVAINMLFDLAILLLPLPTLWGLKLPLRKKIVVTIMFSFGIATIAIMIWRIVATLRTRADPDFTLHLGTIGLISFFELWFGIIVACMPTLAPLFRAYAKPLVSKLKAGPDGSSSSASYALADLPRQAFGRNNIHGSKYDRIDGGKDAVRGEARSQEPHGRGMIVTTEIFSTSEYRTKPGPMQGSSVGHIWSDVDE
ncbi:hypothetical protein GGS23DRAFT_570527 [Durotheca rogersii]|uniref:uncharacterized protein n=1 Tax=Durotheca rogersii TaxID=419775 RepID=UPI002220BA99|nr:uncharacterized protein GGS23DRAFT_570527 [Durotheca rogersii]KAI5862502.1 hypothetical protein GGS23DRAFT_570527 [Durotheca rogersii]